MQGKVKVSLALAAGPGFPEGSPDHRYELELVLDGAGGPDAGAWLADPEAWRAARHTPDEGAAAGDVQHDPDHGWSARFFTAAAEGPDAPETRFAFGAEPVRPGAYVAVVGPDAVELTYRVVAVA